MANYAQNLSHSSCKDIYDIIEWCHNALPVQWKATPWKHPELLNGIGLLSSDEALNCYMSAYGEMHTSKCRAAMMSFPYNEVDGTIEIIDWGCGQGIGSATVIDVLQQHNLSQWLRRVTLIEPSPNALERAACNIKLITNNGIHINPVNKYLPSVDGLRENTISSIGYTYSNVIHVFSNILDVKTIDLATVARMVASSHSQHYVLCIGPTNAAAYRIDQFCEIFGNQAYFSNIRSVRYGRTKRTGHPYTCLARCFAYNGNPLDVSRMLHIPDSEEAVYGDYDLQLQIQNKTLSKQKARVAYRLQNMLSVDDIFYVDPVVNEVKVDFIIVRPNKGVLLLNVCELNLNKCSLTEDKKVIKTEDGTALQSPLELIDQCYYSIKDGIEELLMSTIENSKNYGLIKKVIVFTENSIEEVKKFYEIRDSISNYTFLYGEEFINNKDISRTLYPNIHFNYNSTSFNDAIKRKIASIVSPSWHSYQEGRVGLEPKGEQRGLVVSRITQQKISGVAGSGKTQVLATRAINAIKRCGGDVLILTYNITLANYIKYRLSEIREDFSWDKIDVCHYHRFFRIRASECHLHVEFDSYEDESFFEKVNNHKRYSAIFVDEVQDYMTEWLKIVMQYFLAPEGGNSDAK